MWYDYILYVWTAKDKSIRMGIRTISPQIELYYLMVKNYISTICRSMLNHYYIPYGKTIGMIYLANINGQRNQYKELTFLNGHN